MDIYAYQKPLGKIDDIPELKNEFIVIYDTKSHKQMVQFCLALGQHIIEVTGFKPDDEITASFEAMQKWIDGKVNYHEARNLSFKIGRLAKIEKDQIKARFFRTMAQIAASPHVKYHSLWATDFAVTLINRLYPGDMNEVKKEREKQIELLRNIKQLMTNT
jgi:hypothetical protein